jgi:hypothetical protein
MKPTMLVALIALSTPLTATDGVIEGDGTPKPEPITYEVADVTGKLWLEVEPEARRLESGDQPVSGDRLRTGSSSAATLGVPTHTAVFRLDAKTTCTLAHGRPGLLLHVERGRFRALFGSFTGEHDRLVTTPSAVLAVRGTDYGVTVDKKGATELVVFEGVVEVLDPTGAAPPVRVEAGHRTRIRVGRPPTAPKAHRTSGADWNRRGSVPPPGIGPGGNPLGVGGTPPASQGAGSGSGGSKRRGG